jgi:hypothetical protein
MKSFLSNLNTRLLIIHFIAFWLFMYGVQTLAFSHDYKFLYYGSERVMRLNFPGRFEADMTFIEQFGNIGLVIAYIISWAISSKRNWHWINSTVVFVVMFLLENLLVLKSPGVHAIFLRSGGLFKVYSLWGHLVIGIVLIAASLSLFFAKRVVRYISYETQKDKQIAKAQKKAARMGK